MKKKISIIVLAAVLVLCVILAVACDKKKGEFTFIQSTGGGVRIGNSQTVMPTNIPEKADEPSVIIHYWRSSASDYKSWGFWLWSESVQPNEVTNIQYQDDYGSATVVPLSYVGITGTGKMGIIARMQDGWTKDTEADRWINFPELAMDSNNYYHIYLYQGDKELYKNVDELTHGLSATFVDETKITITAKAGISHIELIEGDKVIGKGDTTSSAIMHFVFNNKQQPDITKNYKIKAVFADDKYNAECNVAVTALYESNMFKQYNYDGELGAIYSAKQTQFKVWSPVSSRIVLNIYQNGDGTEKAKTYEMSKDKKGVFSVTVKGDLAKKYYTYTVYNNSYPTGQEIVDPYAKSAGLSGKRGQIVDFSAAELTPEGWNKVSPIAYDANELVVWETHVADVTSSDTWNGTEANRKKFLGMIESGTTYQGYKTGFDHIVELGVNAVQLVPIFDQANDEANPEFNWGYNPLNYNVLEGSYSSNASDGYVRIKEFRQLVQKFNEAGINIIMDVVYNHVNQHIGSNFDVLMPEYYFRYNEAGDVYSGSGCGNDTASEHYMYRKFMIDSVCFWAKEYKLGGFRFDLMGLHDIETMNKLAVELRKINPSIIIYGEPWNLTTGLAQEQKVIQANFSKVNGVAQFSDVMRDALIAGGMNAVTNKGWSTASLSDLNGTMTNKIKSGLQGFTRSTPAINDLYKTVNYVTCHDNYTLKDRIRAAGIEDDATVKSMAMLSNSVVLTSNGINFMLAGEEFLRSKGDLGANSDEIHNSYNASYEVNALDYSLKVTNHDMFENYQKLIAFKRMFVKNFGLNSNAAVSANYKVDINTTGNLIVVTINAADGKTWKVIHSNGARGAAAITADLAGYTLYLDTLNLGSSLTFDAATPIAQYQTIIAYKA